MVVFLAELNVKVDSLFSCEEPGLCEVARATIPRILSYV